MRIGAGRVRGFRARLRRARGSRPEAVLRTERGLGEDQHRSMEAGAVRRGTVKTRMACAAARLPATRREPMAGLPAGVTLVGGVAG